MAEYKWRLAPDIFLRKAGFPYDLMEQLYCPDVTDAVQELLKLEAEREDLRRRVLGWCRDAAASAPMGMKAYLRWLRKAVSKRRVAERPTPTLLPDDGSALVREWNEVSCSLQVAYEEAGERFRDGMEDIRRRFRTIVRQERFQEAVLLNSPDMYEVGLKNYLRRHGQPSSLRRHETKLMLYLQRFCAKNETASFFGPMNYGVFDSSAACSIHFNSPPRGAPLKRRVLLSHWAAEAVACAMARDERLALERRPMRSALVELTNRGVIAPGLANEFVLGPLAKAVLHCADGSLSLRRIAEAEAASPLQILDEASRLERLNLINLGLPIEPHTVDSLGAVRRIVRGFPSGEAREHLSKATELLRYRLKRFENADLHERVRLLRLIECSFASLTGEKPRRGGGELYIDRLLLYEERSGDVQDLTVGGPLYEDMTDSLQASLNLLGAYALAEQHRLYKQGRLHLQGVAGRANRRDHLLTLYLEARRGGELLFEDPPLSQQWEQDWKAILSEHQNSSCISVHGAQLASGVRLEELRNEKLLVGPDVMIAAKDRAAVEQGDYKLVLAEAHPKLMPTHKFLTLFHPDLEGLLQRGRTQLFELTFPEREALLASHRISKIDNWPIGRPKIHPLWYRRRTSDQGLDVALSEVKVAVAATGGCTFLLPHESLPAYFEMPLVAEEPMPSFLLAFTRARVWSIPVKVGSHSPRVEIDGVVYQRERWNLGSDEFPDVEPPFDSFDSFWRLWKWKHRRGIPDQAFLKVAEERKPLLVDFLSPLSCSCFLYALKGSREAVVTEMLPKPNELWLQQDGKRYTSELRFNALRLPEGHDPERVVGLAEEGGVVGASPSKPLEPTERAGDGQGQGTLHSNEASYDLQALADHLRLLQKEVGPLVTED